MPDFSQTLNISEENYNALIMRCTQIKAEVDGARLKYCAINNNITIYSDNRNIQAYNCMGIVIQVLNEIGLQLNPNALRFPSSFEKELTQRFPRPLPLPSIMEENSEDSGNSQESQHTL